MKKSLNNNILNILNVKGISIKKMSEDIDLDYATVHRLVSRPDLSTTSLGRLKLVSDYLNVHVSDLYDTDDYVDYASFYNQGLTNFNLSCDEMVSCFCFLFGMFSAYADSEYSYCPNYVLGFFEKAIASVRDES